MPKMYVEKNDKILHTHARTLVGKLGLLRKLQELKSNVDDNTECDRKHKYKHDVSVLTW